LINNQAAQNNAGMRGALDNLAATGGVSSGARERMAKSSIRDMMMGRQDIRQQGASDRFNILAQDENNRIKQLSDLTGMEMTRGQFAAGERDKGLATRQYDITNSLNTLGKERDDDLQAWNKNQETWAAGQTANAQAAAASKGSCFVAGTFVKMEDGSQKAIEQIFSGDRVEGGGKVITTLTFNPYRGTEVYDYGGIVVSGGHAVKENGQWLRVKDSAHATLLEKPAATVYNLITENHRILIGAFEFTDFDETDIYYLSDAEQLKILNGEMDCLRSISGKNMDATA
jgi:hypothetical protein